MALHNNTVKIFSYVGIKQNVIKISNMISEKKSLYSDLSVDTTLISG